MQLVFEHAVAAPSGRVFAFHEDPANLAVLLEGWRSFRLLRHAGSIRPGGITALSERLFLLPVHMEFEHDLYDPPRRFGEHQRRGPFARFVHVHEFEPLEGGTLVRDRLDVALPPSFGGELLTRTVVAPRLRRFFAVRHRALDRLFGSFPAAA
jgi:ligand-binding SRPBCC domain-containing protein